MTTFRYAALDLNGRHKTGLIDATASDEAIEKLRARGETPLRVHRTKKTAADGLTRGELAVLLADLAALYGAGVPLRRALEVLSEGSSSRSATLARVLSERIDAGQNLGSAASRNMSGDLLLVSALIRSGEASGKLAETLAFSSQLLERQETLKRRFASALAYPAFLLILSLASLIILATLTGPAIAPLINDTPDPPADLVFLLNVGEVITSNAAVLSAGVVAAAAALTLGAKHPAIRTWSGSWIASLPGVGIIHRDLNCGAYGRALGSLLSGGTPAATAMDLAFGVVPNPLWRARFKSAANQLQNGHTISGCLGTLSACPPELLRLARIGEASGALGGMLSRAGDLLSERALRRLNKVAAGIGPASILVLGAVTGWIMSAFLSGLSQLGEGAI